MLYRLVPIDYNVLVGICSGWYEDFIGHMSAHKCKLIRVGTETERVLSLNSKLVAHSEPQSLHCVLIASHLFRQHLPSTDGLVE